MSLTFHHTGILTTSPELTLQNYVSLFGAVPESNPVFISKQQVTVQLLTLPGNARLELVTPHPEASALLALAKRGITYYHTAFTSDDFDYDVAQLIKHDHRALDAFTSELFDLRRCQFFVAPDQSLLEIIES